MRLLKKVLAAGLFVFLAASANASVTNPELNKDYFVLQQPQQTDSVGKIEVTEFFYYSCPHCNMLDPVITEWVKKQGNAISFKRVHVDFGQGQAPLQRMYYTLEAMGKVEALHAKIFDAIHKERQYIRTDSEAADFVAKNGVDREKYLLVSKSFAIQAKMSRATQMQAAYKIEGVPTIFVDGHYMTSPSTLTTAYPGMPEHDGDVNVLQVLDALVLKAQKDHGIKK